MRNINQLIVIGGPTASGKSSLAVELALMLGAEIFSADSRQIYREMKIGTAVPIVEEMKDVKHHFIQSHSIFEEFNAGKYEDEVLNALENYFLSKNTAILVGGTGLYIQAVLQGLDEMPKISNTVNEEVEADYKKHGLAYLVEELLNSDPEYAQTADLENPRRVLRALAVIRQSGKPFSQFRAQEPKKRNFQSHLFLLEPERIELYERINARVDNMIEKGLEEEARNLFPHRHLKSLQTVGYQEFFQYFHNEITREEAIDLIKRNSRRYAKRQGTWFRKYGNWQVVPSASKQEDLEFIMTRIRSAGM